jgi:hypothetical protein
MPTNLNHKDPINTELENLEKEQETVESVISGLKKLTIKVGNSTKKLIYRTFWEDEIGVIKAINLTRFLPL